MTLKELHQKLSKDAGYRKQYAKLEGMVELAINIRAAREDRGLTQAELAQTTGVRTVDLSRFETLAGDADPEVVSKLVDYLEVPLRAQGIKVEDWILSTSGQGGVLEVRRGRQGRRTTPLQERKTEDISGTRERDEQAILLAQPTKKKEQSE